MLRSILTSIVSSISLIAMTFELDIRTNINPVNVSGFLGASCENQNDILYKYVSAKIIYLKLRYDTERAIFRTSDYDNDIERDRRYHLLLLRGLAKRYNLTPECYEEPPSDLIGI